MQRYDLNYVGNEPWDTDRQMQAVSDGDWVTYDDAAALEAENAALREKLAAADADLAHLNNQITLGLHERHTLLASLGAANRKLSAAEARTVLTDEQIEDIARSESYSSWDGMLKPIVAFARAILAASAAPAAQEDAARLDFLDQNMKFNMHWRINQAPAGNLSIQSVICMNSSITIRAAIDAARAKFAIAANTPKGT